MSHTNQMKKTLRDRVGSANAWKLTAITAAAKRLARKTLLLDSRQTTVEPAEPIEIDKQHLISVMRKFLAVPSYSYQDRSKMSADAFLELHRILRESYPNAHRVLERETVNELSLLYRWPGRDRSAAPILLMSHLDVVPVEQASEAEWTHPPKEATLADGYLWGRGALDVKCGVVAIMAALEQLCIDGFAPEQDLYFAFGHDEEVGGRDGNAVIAQQFLQQGIRFAFVLDEGGAILDGIIPGVDHPVAFVAIAEKRMAESTLTARGVGGHGSMPGRSAIVNLARAIDRMDQQPMPTRMTDATWKLFEYLGSEMPLLQGTVIANRRLFGSLVCRQLAARSSTAGVVRSTINVTRLSTSAVSNQNATVATATVNTRLLPGDSLDEVEAHVRRITDDILLPDGERAIEFRQGPVSNGDQIAPTDCDEFRMIQRTIQEVFPEVVVAPGLTAVSTDAAKYERVTDKIYRFIPMRVNQTDLKRIHGVDERIGVENLHEIVQFYIRLLHHASACPESWTQIGVVDRIAAPWRQLVASNKSISEVSGGAWIE